MKHLKKLSGAFVIIVMSVLACTWINAKNRLSDEYMYALKSANLLFSIKPGNNSEQQKMVNYLLLVHLNRFSVARGYIPSLFVAEEEQLFCASFNLDSDGMAGFQEYATKKVLEYTQYVTKYCEY